MQFSTADIDLARRVEAAEAANGYRTARALQQTSPAVNAVAEPFLGGCAVFAGVGSPLTHALGIGMNGQPAPAELDRMEAFFRERGSPVLIDLCPMADPGLLQAIFARGYRVIEFNNQMARRIAPGEQFPDAPAGIEISATPDRGVWAGAVARGFQEREDADRNLVDLLAGMSALGSCYLASLGSTQAGGGGMSMHDGVACLYGDGTVLAARNRGVHRALIQARLRDAARAGCDLAMASVLPGSGSHRNYERAGFELLFMRVNLSLP